MPLPWEYADTVNPGQTRVRDAGLKILIVVRRGARRRIV
jgi:hypothetical protein